MIDSLILNPPSAAGDQHFNDESFLPRILSIFYATFDPRVGPKVVYQVPEGSIKVSDKLPDSARSPSFLPRSSVGTPATFASGSSTTNSESWVLEEPEPLSLGATRAQSLASDGSPSPFRASVPLPNDGVNRSTDKLPLSPLGLRQGTSGLSQSRPPALHYLSNTSIKAPQPGNYLVDFDAISEYVIPKSKLCGRLVHCNTPKNRILGFPVVLSGDRYLRRDFRFNLCFVFDRWADLSCYEPVVRKCATVLINCEDESQFLSNSQTSSRMYSVIEQLYEDLNSFSETSIRIDSFNSIELKIFPFYPNPPKVHDWDVPIALINLTRRVEPNWDLTMAKVVPFINGVNHVRKIADLADTDPNLTRKCMEHLLFYQCVLMVDTFQYSNMYTLKQSIQWLTEDPNVQSECGPYVTRQGLEPLPWPQLLRLYSRLKRGKTVHDWLEENEVPAACLDVRRFLSFGVIKGYIRRIRRYPILLPSRAKKKKGESGKSRALTLEDFEYGGSPTQFQGVPASVESSSSLATLHAFRLPGRSVGVMDGSPPTTAFPPMRGVRPRQGSIHSSLSAVNKEHASQPYFASTAAIMNTTSGEASISSSWKSGGGPPGPLTRANTSATIRTRPTSATTRPSNAPFANTISLAGSGGTVTNLPTEAPLYPTDILGLLDGDHHSDELCTKYAIGWAKLEEWLYIIGWEHATPNFSPAAVLEKRKDSRGQVDFGRIKIIYR